MTDEQKRKFNKVLCEALEPKPAQTDHNYNLPRAWWEWRGFLYASEEKDGTWAPRYDLFSDWYGMGKLIEAMEERGWCWRAFGTIRLPLCSASDSKCHAVFESVSQFNVPEIATTFPEATALAAARVLGLEVPRYKTERQEGCLNKFWLAWPMRKKL